MPIHFSQSSYIHVVLFYETLLDRQLDLNDIPVDDRTVTPANKALGSLVLVLAPATQA